MKSILLSFLILTSAYADNKDCVTEAPSYVDVMRSSDFRTDSTEYFISKFKAPIERLSQYRATQKNLTAEQISNYCKAQCNQLADKDLISTCARFCNIQRLTIRSECLDRYMQALQICNKKSDVKVSIPFQNKNDERATQ